MKILVPVLALMGGNWSHFYLPRSSMRVYKQFCFVRKVKLVQVVWFKITADLKTVI